MIGSAVRASLVMLALALSATLVSAQTDRWTEQDVEQAIRDASVSHQVSATVLTCIAMRESRMDPYAESRTGDFGAFQFHQNRDGSSLMDLTPWSGRSLYDPYASAHATAWLINQGYGYHWSTYGGCR